MFATAVGAANVLVLRPNNDVGTTSATGTGGVNALNGAWEYAARNRGAKFLSTVVAVGDYSVYSAKSWLIDGTHPNPAGSVSIAAAVYAGDLNAAALGRSVPPVSVVKRAGVVLPTGTPVIVPNANPVAPTLALGDLTINTGVVKSSADLLSGATDADGDTLTVTGVTAVSGGTVSGTGPWTITPTAAGAGSATVAISDGRGGAANRTVTWNGIAAFTFDLRPTATMALDSAVPAGAVAAGLSASVSGGVVTVTAGSNVFTPGGLPQYLVYDNHGGKTPGAAVELAATVGSWSLLSPSGPAPVYHAGGIGGKPFVRDWHGPSGAALTRRFNFPTPVTEAFVAKALRFPQYWTGGNDNGPYWDYEEHYIPRDSTIKTDWGRYDPSGGDPSTDIIFGSHTQSDTLAMGGNSVPMILGMSLTPLVSFNRWMEFRGWIKDNPANHALSSASLRLSTPRGVKENRSSAVTVLSPNGIGYAPLNLMLTGAWVDQNPLAIVERAYVYVAGGTNSACRIEIGNRPVYSECEFTHPCPPSAWSGTSVSAPFDRGQIPPGAPCYAYVMLADDLPAGGGIGTLVEGA